MRKLSGEKHHIKPKSLFPELAKDKTNIIKLTYREHYICHWLLYKVYEELGDKFALHKMAAALWYMSNSHNEFVTPKQFEIVRQKFTDSIKNRVISEESRIKMGIHSKGIPKSEIQKQKQRNAMIGRTPWNKGIYYSPELAEKIKTCRSGKDNGFYGKHQPDSAKLKLREEFTCNVFWNNGIINKRCKDYPGEGWIRGRLKK